jgi:hypothetical protein
MQKLRKIAATLGFVGAVIATTAFPAAADWYGRHHHYYNFYGGNPDPHCTYAGCCPLGYTVQGGICRPYEGPRGPFAPPGSRFWWQ